MASAKVGTKHFRLFVVLNHVAALIKTHAVYAVADVLEAESILAEISQQTFRNTSAGDVQVRPLQKIFVRSFGAPKKHYFLTCGFVPSENSEELS